MALYTVFGPRAGEGEADPMAHAFVKEGISWPALFFAEIWMIVCRMWLVLVLYVAVVAIIALAGRLIGDNLAAAVIFLGHVLFAIEGNELKRWTLARRGLRMIDVVEARNETEAEIRFFSRDGDRIAARSDPPAPPPPRPSAGRSGGDEIVGLFPTPAGSANS